MFEENKKLLSFDGILGRRDFLVNGFIVTTIKCVIFSFFAYLGFFKPEFAQQLLLNVDTKWFLLLKAIIGFCLCLLFFPSIVRRVRDILAEKDNNKLFVISSFITVLMFSKYTPLGSSDILVFFESFVVILLLFMKGKITSVKPKSEIIKFNFGAFFGTWIWGLFNKQYKTLIAIPLFLTFAWIPYMFICGLKGNEWVYEKEKSEDLDKFHTKQMVQSITFSILSPVIFVALVMAFSIATMHIAVRAYGTEKVLSFMTTRTKIYQTLAAQLNFSKIELKEDEYVFYIEPKVWKSMSLSMKKSAFNTAVRYVQYSEEKYSNRSYEQEELDIIEILNKLVIKSTYNDEILGDFHLDTTKLEKDLKTVDKVKKFDAVQQIVKIIDKGFIINEDPTMP